MNSRATRPRFATLFVIYLATLGLAAPTAAQNSPLPFTSEDALNVASLTVRDITDNGRYVVATRATPRDRKNVDHMRFGDPTYMSPSFADVLVIDTETREQTSLFDEKVQARSFAWSPDGGTVAFLVREDDEYFLHTYERERGRLRKVNLKTDKGIASNSPLTWRPDGSGVVLALREEGWAQTARQMFLDLSVGPTIVQDSREPFLAWEVVRNQGSLMIPALVDVRSRDVTELMPESRYSGLTQSEDGEFLSFVETTPVKTSYTRNGGAEYQRWMCKAARRGR